MSEWLTQFEDKLATPGRLNRRSFLGRLLTVSFAVTAAIAGATFPPTATQVRATACCNLNLPCCCSWCGFGATCFNCSGTCWEWICCIPCSNCTCCGSCSSYDCIECGGENCSCESFQGPVAPHP